MSQRPTTNALDWTECPHCNSSWDGGSILDTFVKKRTDGDPYYKDKSNEELMKIVADAYGDVSRRWSRQIGIEIQGEYDGVLYVQCPDCQAVFHRFTGKQYDGPVLFTRRPSTDPSS